MVVSALDDVLIGQSRSYLLALLADSALSTSTLASTALVAAYFDRPRITVVSGAFATVDSQTVSLSFEADLLGDSIARSPTPDRRRRRRPLQTARGIMEYVLETHGFSRRELDRWVSVRVGCEYHHCVCGRARQ